MLSFKVEYAVRILVEMTNLELAGIPGVPIVWLKGICGNDTRGLSIVLRILNKIGWVNYDKGTYLYSSNINIDKISLYDLCLQVDESHKSLAPSISNDDTSKELAGIFKTIKLSRFISYTGSKLKKQTVNQRNP